MEEIHSDDPCLRYIRHEAKDFAFLHDLVKNRYDLIVDFLIYPSIEEYRPFGEFFLQNTGHYIFLSSYRVYADSLLPITEESPRLLDTLDDKDYLSSGDYSIYKAQQEDFLKEIDAPNYTILRPVITFSKGRFQLTTLEADTFMWMMMHGKTVLLPEEAMDCIATLSWAGNFGKLVSRLANNPAAMKETFTVGSAEYHTWREIAALYNRIGGLHYVTTDQETYLKIVFENNRFCIA